MPKHPNPAKARKLDRKLLKEGLGDRFEGMAKEQIIQALKKTQEEIWSEKIAPRP